VFVPFELMQLKLNLIYTYSINDCSLKFGNNLHWNNGCSWLCLCCAHTCIWTCTQILQYHGYTVKTTDLIFIEAYINTITVYVCLIQKGTILDYIIVF